MTTGNKGAVATCPGRGSAAQGMIPKSVSPGEMAIAIGVRKEGKELVDKKEEDGHRETLARLRGDGAVESCRLTGRPERNGAVAAVSRPRTGRNSRDGSPHLPLYLQIALAFAHRLQLLKATTGSAGLNSLPSAIPPACPPTHLTFRL